ncbi:MAG: hypothetical protein ABR585_13875, partial [Gemmatimonadaceae bacterium]
SCADTVDVRITAVEGAKYISPDTPPKHPQLLAWVENLGNKSTYDGFQPASSVVYALVVDAAPAGDKDAHPIIYRVAFSATDSARVPFIQDTYGHVYPCHLYKQPLFSEADFQACNNAHRYGAKPRAPLSLGAMVTSLVTWSSSRQWSNDPTWFSCSSGCCTSSAVQVAAY